MNFDKYRSTEKYPDKIKYKAELIETINTCRLTKADRDKEIALVPNAVGKWFQDALKPYQEQAAEIETQFWADKNYTEKQCLIIQGEAYEIGHSGGYEEIYNCLENIVSFCDRMRAAN